MGMGGQSCLPKIYIVLSCLGSMIASMSMIAITVSIAVMLLLALRSDNLVKPGESSQNKGLHLEPDRGCLKV